MTDLAALVERLETENDALRARVSDLENLLIGKADELIPIEVSMKLTQSERIVLGVLLRRERATKDQIMAALYRNIGKDEADPKIVDVFICKLRRKLKPHEIEIGTIWGQGYFVDAATKEKLRGMGNAEAA